MILGFLRRFLISLHFVLHHCEGSGQQHKRQALHRASFDRSTLALLQALRACAADGSIGSRSQILRDGVRFCISESPKAQILASRKADIAIDQQLAQQTLDLRLRLIVDVYFLRSTKRNTYSPPQCLHKSNHSEPEKKRSQ
jgi:hypothetical protein